jgi:hypothetical protein
MNCELFESRLNALLDDRRCVEQDDELSAHLAQCIRCRRLARAYAAMLDGAEILAAGSRTQLSNHGHTHAPLANRAECQMHNSVPAFHWRKLPVPAAFAAAATLLLVIWWEPIQKPAADVNQVDVPRHGISDIAPARPATLTFDLPATMEDYEQVWVVTGRRLALLPTAVRRVATDPQTSAVGPVVASLEATVDALLRAWSPVRAETEGKTGRIEPESVQEAVSAV